MGGNRSDNNNDGSNQKSKAISKMTQIPKYNPNVNKPKAKDYSVVGPSSEKDDTAARLDLFYNKGATDIKNLAGKTPSPTLAILSGPLQAGSKKTREFFTEKVLGSKNFRDMSKRQFERLSSTQQEDFYQSYLSNRQSGVTDAYGNIKSNRDSQGGGSYVDPMKSIQQPKVASQMDNTGIKSDMVVADKITTNNMAQLTEDKDAILTKRKGRTATINTSVLGDTSYPTLGKKRLLG